MYSPTQATTSKIEWQGIRGDKYFSLQIGRVDLERHAAMLFGNVATPFDQLTSRLTGCNNNYGIDSFERPESHERQDELVQAELVRRATMTSRWASTTRPRMRIGRSAPATARRTRAPASPRRQVGNYRARLPNASRITGRCPSRWRPAATATRDGSAGLRAEGSHAHDLGVRAGQLDDRAPADAESGCPLRPCCRVHPGTVPVGVGCRRSRPCTRRSALPAIDFPTWNSIVPRLARRLRRHGRRQAPSSRAAGDGSPTTGTPTSCRWRTRTFTL